MTDPWKGIHPRYRLYCLAHGYASMAEARAAYGGWHDYHAWMGSRWSEWRRLNKRSEWSPLSEADHAAFDAWLERTVTMRDRPIA